VRAAAGRFAVTTDAPLAEVTPPWGPAGPELARKFWSAHETRLTRHFPRWEAEMDPGLVACIRAGNAISISDYQDLRERKYAYVAQIHAWFEDWDFLITPTVSVAAFPADRLMRSTGHSTPGLDELGRVLAPVQHVLEPGGDGSLRLHPRRPAGRVADRRPAVRRPRRAAGLGGLRAGAALGGQTATVGGVRRHAMLGMSTNN